MLKEYVAEFAKYKRLGSQTLAQLSDEGLNAVAYHVGQIVLLGRAAQAGSWDYLYTTR